MLASSPGGNRWQLVALPPAGELEGRPETSKRQGLLEGSKPHGDRSRSPPRRHWDGPRRSRSCSPKRGGSRGRWRSTDQQRSRSRSRSRGARCRAGSPERCGASQEALGLAHTAAWQEGRRAGGSAQLQVAATQPSAAGTPLVLQAAQLLCGAPALPVVLLPQMAAGAHAQMAPHALVPVPINLLPSLVTQPLSAGQPAWAAAAAELPGPASAAGGAAAAPTPGAASRTVLLSVGSGGPQLALPRVGELMQQLRRLLGPGAGIECLTCTTPDRALVLFSTPAAALAASARLHGCHVSGGPAHCLCPVCLACLTAMSCWHEAICLQLSVVPKCIGHTPQMPDEHVPCHGVCRSLVQYLSGAASWISYLPTGVPTHLLARLPMTPVPRCSSPAPLSRCPPRCSPRPVYLVHSARHSSTGGSTLSTPQQATVANVASALAAGCQPAPARVVRLDARQQQQPRVNKYEQSCLPHSMYILPAPALS